MAPSTTWAGVPSSHRYRSPRLDAVTPPATAETARPLPPPGIHPTSIKWAAIVPGVALLMLGVVIVINVLTAPGPDPAPSPRLKQVSGLVTSPTPPFKALVFAGEPPDEIVAAAVVPVGAVQVDLPHTGGEATSYDRSIVFESPASSQALYTYFTAQMKGRGWKIFSTGKPAHAPGVEILSQRGGSDSWFWEQGVDISPTTFSKDGTLQTTRFTIRLYQASMGS